MTSTTTTTEDCFSVLVVSEKYQLSAASGAVNTAVTESMASLHVMRQANDLMIRSQAEPSSSQAPTVASGSQLGDDEDVSRIWNRSSSVNSCQIF